MTEYSDRGIPIVTLENKLEYLAAMLKEGAYEDAAGHLCDLLELCRNKIRTDDGMMFADLKAMVGYYGRHPTPIKPPPERYP